MSNFFFDFHMTKSKEKWYFLDEFEKQMNLGLQVFLLVQVLYF
jgi:hypothetical protein